jgi:hypothetical protein
MLKKKFGKMQGLKGSRAIVTCMKIKTKGSITLEDEMVNGVIFK